MHSAQCVRVVAQPSADDVRDCGQTVEDPSGRVLGRCHLDLFQRNDKRIHKNVFVGNFTFDDQENE